MISDALEGRTADGVTLRMDRVRATGERRGVVVCLHAMMTDGRYFGARRERGFATTLAAAGLDVVVADFRGHGHSVPPHAGREDWSFDDLVERDLPAIVDAVAAASACRPDELVLLGHSLGGLVSTAAIGTKTIRPPRALLLAATSVWLGETAARRALMTAYRGVTALFGRAPIRALRAGTADESKGYVDQLTGWARAGRWTSLGGVDYSVALEMVEAPTWACVGAGDWMCTVRDAQAIAGRIQSCDPLRVVGRAHRDRLDPDHFQLFTRPELAPLWNEIAARAIG